MPINYIFVTEVMIYLRIPLVFVTIYKDYSKSSLLLYSSHQHGG